MQTQHAIFEVVCSFNVLCAPREWILYFIVLSICTLQSDYLLSLSPLQLIVENRRTNSKQVAQYPAWTIFCGRELARC
jgi:hypothetical protein